MPFDYREEYQRYQHYYLNLKRFYQQPVARVSIFVVISFLTVSFFSVFAIRPTLVTIGKLVKEIEDKQRISQQLDQKIARLAQVQAESAQVKPDWPKILAAMPERPELASLIWQLELTAARNGLKLLNLQVEPVDLNQVPAGKDLPSIAIGVTLGGGNLTQIKNLAELLANLGRLIVIEETTLTTATPALQKEGIGVTLNLRGKVYFTKEADAG